MNRAEQLNKLFSGDDQNSIINKQISTSDSSTSTAKPEDLANQQESTQKSIPISISNVNQENSTQDQTATNSSTSIAKPEVLAKQQEQLDSSTSVAKPEVLAKQQEQPQSKQKRIPRNLALKSNSCKQNPKAKQQNNTGNQTAPEKSFKENNKANLDSSVATQQNPISKENKSLPKASQKPINKKLPSIVKSKNFYRSPRNLKSSKKMSDWGDEETTEVIGKGFGNDTEAYKSNNDDDYQNEDDNNNNNDKRRFNGGGGGGRGRNGGGRGGGRGGGFNRYNKDNDDNEENGGESNGYGGERRNGGFGGGRGRGGGRGGGGRDGGRREFNNNKGENDEHNTSGGGGDGEDGEPKKPREFYIPPEPTENEDEIFGSGITSGINFSKYDSIPVKVTGENAPAPIQSFEEANLRDIVINNIKRSGYKIPTPIQKTAIPVITSGRDLMACAQTGSGKTAAFLLPIINSLLSEGAETSIGKPHALVVSPTRELAIQIFNEARKFALGSYLNIRIVYGGTSSKHQGENIGRGGSHILICTPGRLLDFVEKGFITFEDTRFVVLDEADRMLDMGFKESMATIMNHPTMRPMEERQNLMFSATFPAEIQRMAGEYLNEYIFISIGVVGGACSDVTQNIYEVKKFQKRAKLMDLLKENPDGTIVFVETKRGADFLASLLSETEFPTTSIHGDRLQSQREMALADFKSGKMKVLIATSVAARGLDIKNVNHVVNYDMPSSIDEYVHRIGRTGRVGNNGRATSFFDPESDSAIAADLVNILEGAGQEVPDFLKNYSGGGGGGGDLGGSKFGGRDVRKGVPQDLLKENPDGTIVFVETKRGADFLASLLSETEFPTTSIHGDRLQSQREMALADFKSGKMKVLIATSVAARGLDIKNVNHVVNYDMPSSIDEYVHRIGRTGRVGNNGRATSFFDPESDSAIAADLVNILEGAGQEVPDFLKNYSGGGGGGGDLGGSKFGGRDVRKGVPQDLLKENPDGTIVFVETKRGADFLASLLSETEFPTTSIHGDRLQSQREMALADFKSGKMKVLIATSVAARGLDIKNVNHVVNYDMPSSIDEYVHRIGRTGRVGNNGRATSFFDPESDSAIAADLVNILEGAGQEVPDFLKNYSGGGGGGGDLGGSKFGGRDVRKGVPQTDDNFVTSSGPSALEDDEEWC